MLINDNFIRLRKLKNTPNSLVYISDYFDNLKNKLWITVTVKENQNNSFFSLSDNEFDFQLDSLMTYNKEIKDKILTSTGTKKNKNDKVKIMFLNDDNNGGNNYINNNKSSNINGEKTDNTGIYHIVINFIILYYTNLSIINSF